MKLTFVKEKVKVEKFSYLGVAMKIWRFVRGLFMMNDSFKGL